ncbi:Hypothetical protein D9617_1g088440 [Elsinoe fawcettii]|nr:Hypothetical protein D9617_1g088440 [Elsinoe fawcettii]
MKSQERLKRWRGSGRISSKTTSSKTEFEDWLRKRQCRKVRVGQTTEEKERKTRLAEERKKQKRELEDSTTDICLCSVGDGSVRKATTSCPQYHGEEGKKLCVTCKGLWDKHRNVFGIDKMSDDDARLLTQPLDNRRMPAATPRSKYPYAKSYFGSSTEVQDLALGTIPQWLLPPTEEKEELFAECVSCSGQGNRIGRKKLQEPQGNGRRHAYFRSAVQHRL